MAHNYGSTSTIPASEKISSILTRINGNLQNIRQITQSLSDLCEILGSSRDNTSKRDEIQKLQKKANELLSLTKSLFETAHLVRNIDERSKLTVMKAQTEFERIISKYSEVQKQIVGRLGQLADNLRTTRAGSRLNDDAIINYDDDTAQLQDQMVESDEDEEMIQALETEKRIKELEKNLAATEEMFDQLFEVVKEGAENVDAIEVNVINANENVESANVQLQNAVFYKKSAFKKKVIIVIVIVVILAIIGLIIGIEVKKK